MADNKERDEQDKGFIVRDRRFSARKEEEKASEEKPKTEKEPQKGQTSTSQSQRTAPLPEVSFSSLILSLTTSALVQLGEIHDPSGKESGKNLPLAKQTIDLLDILKEKTKGNLTVEEERLIDNVLYDLKLKYVRAVG